MNSKNDLLNIGEVYGKALLNEEKHTFPKGTFKYATDKKVKKAEASPKAFVHKDSGPIKAAQTHPSINNVIDPAKMTKKQLETNLYEPGKFSQKNESSGINIHMSKKFDDLFKDVMSDKLHLREDKDIETVEDVAELPELGGAADDDLGDNDLGDEEAKSPAEIIDNIIDLLSQLRDSVAGEEAGEDHGMEGLGAEEKGEDDEAYAAEATGFEEVKGGKGGGIVAKKKGAGYWNVHNPVDGDGKLVPDSKGNDLANPKKGIDVKTSWKTAGGKAVWNVDNPVDGDGKLVKDSDLHNPKKKIEVDSTVKAGRQIGQ